MNKDCKQAHDFWCPYCFYERYPVLSVLITLLGLIIGLILSFFPE